MKIIVLCNMTSTDPLSYFSPLTYQGLTDADNLVEILRTKKIDKIYCSPFLKTLQTIYPFCIHINKQVKIEPAFHDEQRIEEISRLGEQRNRRFTSLIGYEYLSEIIDSHYKAKFFRNNIRLEERKQDIINRLYPVLYKICEKYKHGDRRILIVTHYKISDHIARYFGTESIKGAVSEIDIDSSWTSHTN